MSNSLKRQEKKLDKQDEKSLLTSILMSSAVHGALIAALFLTFNWNTESTVVYAELWAPEDISAGVDEKGFAKKEDVEPETKEILKEEPEKEPEPVKANEEDLLSAQKAAENEALIKLKLEQEAQKAQEAAREREEKLAQEKARQEEIRKQQEAIELEKRKEEEAKQREAEGLAQERLAQEKKKAEEARRALEAKQKAEEAKRKAEEARKKAEEARKRELARQEAERKRIAQEIRQQELARLSAKVDETKNFSGKTSGDKSNVRQNLTGNTLAKYHARVVACIRPHITIEVPPQTVRGKYRAEYLLNVLPNGEQVGAPVLLKSSGWPAYDGAVSRAIRRCNPLPRPAVGDELPKQIILSFDPVDDKE